MASNSIVFKIKLAWWFTHLYLPALITFTSFCRLFNVEIKYNKAEVEKVIKLAVKIEQQ